MKLPLTLPSDVANYVNSNRGQQSVQAYIIAHLRANMALPPLGSYNEKDKQPTRAEQLYTQKLI